MENAPEETDEEIIERVERALVRRPWVSADGRRTPLSKMDDTHLANTIFMLQRGTDARGRAVAEKLKKRLPELEAEWRRRYGKKPVVSDRPFNPKMKSRRSLPSVRSLPTNGKASGGQV